MEILLLIVNYKTYSELEVMLQSMSNITTPIRTIVLDNQSNSDSLIFELESKYQVQVIRYKENHGYVGAINEYIRTYNPQFDWLFISNSDIIFQDNNVFDIFVDTVEYNNSIGMYAPSILDRKTNIELNPFRRSIFSKKEYMKLRILLSSYLLSRSYDYLYKIKNIIYKKLFKHNLFKHTNSKIPYSVFAVHGCFFGVKREVIVSQGIETNNFLYYEEEIFGFKCKRSGCIALHDPRVTLLHNSHASTGSKYTKITHNFRNESLRVLSGYL